MSATADQAAPARPTAAEALDILDRWLWKLSGKWARRERVPVTEFMQDLRVRVFVAYPTWDPTRGKLSTWAAWQARQVASVIRWARKRARRERPAGASAGLSMILDTAQARVEWEPPDMTEIREALRNLDPRTRRVLEVRHGIGTEDGKGWTLKELAGEMGLSRERVRQIEQKGLARVRERMTCPQ